MLTKVIVFLAIQAAFCQEFNSSADANVTENSAKVEPSESAPVAVPESPPAVHQEEPQQDAPAPTEPQHPLETEPSAEPTRVPAKTTEASTFPPLVHQDETSSSGPSSEKPVPTPDPARPQGGRGQGHPNRGPPDSGTRGSGSEEPKKGGSATLGTHDSLPLLVLSAFLFRYFN